MAARAFVAGGENRPRREMAVIRIYDGGALISFQRSRNDFFESSLHAAEMRWLT